MVQIILKTLNKVTKLSFLVNLPISYSLRILDWINTYEYKTNIGEFSHTKNCGLGVFIQQLKIFWNVYSDKLCCILLTLINVFFVDTSRCAPCMGSVF